MFSSRLTLNPTWYCRIFFPCRLFCYVFRSRIIRWNSLPAAHHTALAFCTLQDTTAFKPQSASTTTSPPHWQELSSLPTELTFLITLQPTASVSQNPVAYRSDIFTSLFCTFLRHIRRTFSKIPKLFVFPSSYIFRDPYLLCDTSVLISRFVYSIIFWEGLLWAAENWYIYIYKWHSFFANPK